MRLECSTPETVVRLTRLHTVQTFSRSCHATFADHHRENTQTWQIQSSLPEHEIVSIIHFLLKRKRVYR